MLFPLLTSVDKTYTMKRSFALKLPRIGMLLIRPKAVTRLLMFNAQAAGQLMAGCTTYMYDLGPVRPYLSNSWSSSIIFCLVGLFHLFSYSQVSVSI